MKANDEIKNCKAIDVFSKNATLKEVRETDLFSIDELINKSSAEMKANNDNIDGGKNEKQFLKLFTILMNEYKFHAAANEIFKFSSNINQFIDQYKPWALFKNNELDLLNDVLYLAIEGIKTILICLKPFIPQKINEIMKTLDFNMSFSKIDEKNETFYIKEKVNCFNRVLS